MQFTACQHSRFFKLKYWKHYNAVYCLPASTDVSLNGSNKYLQCNLLPAITAVSLNGNNERFTMQFTSCRPAQPFL
jgi:hypothetical protein